mmetsp:Transcript_6344/g.10089  ORF Transcript_6344/g.10089 Transcript_6344/m.10089 type:complete len:295 (+) Transcript_6344:115-999(+)
MSASDTDILHDACINGKLEVIRNHIEKGGDAEMVDGRDRTLLHSAAMKGHLDVMRCLVEDGNAELEPRDKLHRTPLHHACKEWQLGSVKYLVSNKKVDVNCQDCLGLTPLHMVARDGHIYLLKALLDFDSESQTLSSKRVVNPEIPDTRGNTAFHFVADVKTAQLILKSQPPSRINELLNIENMQGQTPMEAAKDALEKIDNKRKKKAKAKLIDYFASFNSQPLFAVESSEYPLQQQQDENAKETTTNPQFNKFQRSFALQIRNQLCSTDIHCVAPIVMSFLSLEDVMNYQQAF